ncbi:hypothetical protein B296_00010726 [Ensete ventricosum]|uniref:Uncharacterized protein n=1 Tax=Ensete ventricosum TaxID=4639 RepID=A0A426Z3U3_ENSVE|nr:hypothetical protein B296_00010726 [Ensete ventricosum]
MVGRLVRTQSSIDRSDSVRSNRIRRVMSARHLTTVSRHTYSHNCSMAALCGIVRRWHELGETNQPMLLEFSNPHEADRCSTKVICFIMAYRRWFLGFIARIAIRGRP